MAKVSTKRKAADAENAAFSPISMPDIGDDEPEVVKKTDGPDVSELLAKISGLTDRIDRAERTNMALMSTPITQVQQQPQAPAKISFDDLPDPSLDPAGYAKAVNERVETNVNARISAISDTNTQRNSMENRVSALWDEFNDKHSDHAENQELVEFAASQVAKRAKNKGIDVEKYMFTSSEQFMSDVVTEIDKITGGKAKGKDADDDEADDASRTTGIFGGLESGGRPAKGKGKDEDAGDMLKEMEDIQRKSGFY